MSYDHVYYHKGGAMYEDGTHIEPEGWYFVDETEAYWHGPFPSRDAANEALIEYAKHL